MKQLLISEIKNNIAAYQGMEDDFEYLDYLSIEELSNILEHISNN